MAIGKRYSTDYLVDSNNNTGSTGQVLTSTLTGIDWADIGSVPGGFWAEIGSDIYNTNSGNVGIGTTSPSYRLQIGVAGGLADSIRIGSYAVAKDTRQYIGYARANNGLFESSGDGDTPSTVLGGVAGIRIVNTAGTLASSAADNSVQLLTHIYNGGSTVALHANYNGNVGIGTTSPSSLLHLEKASGDPMLNIQAVSAGDPGITFTSINNRSGNIFYSDGTTNAMLRYDHADTSFKLYAHNTTVPDFVLSEYTAYFPTQNVGIGTTLPTTALTIRKAISPTDYGGQASMIEFKSYYTGYDTETVKSAIYSGVSDQTTLQTTKGFMSFWTSSEISPAAQNLTEKMRIESDGNVIIGGTSATFNYGGKTLQVNGSRATLALKSTGSLSTFVMSANNSVNTTDIHLNQSGVDGSLTFYQYSNGGTSMTLDGSGNLGIGVTGPSAALQVERASDTTFALSNSASVTSGNRGNLAWYNSDISTVATIRAGADTDNVGTNLQFFTRPVGGAMTETMRIFSNGNVNIGVAETGSSAVTGPFVVTHTSSRFLTSSFEESTVSLSAKNNNNNLESLRLAGDSIKFFNGTNTVGSQTMVILSSGNVGIGVTNPLAPLTIYNSSSIGSSINIQNNVSGTGLTTGFYLGISTGIEAYVWNYENADLVFAANNSEGMRIKSSGDAIFTGNVGINMTSTPAAALHVTGDIFVSAKFGNNNLVDEGIQFEAPTTTMQTCRFDSDALRFYAGGSSTTRFTITESGTSTFINTVTATNFVLSSDETLKDNIKEIDNKHIDVNWKNFELKSEPGVKRSGVIAQELEKKHPEFVRTDDEGLKSVAYIDLLISKIAELEARLEKAGI